MTFIKHVFYGVFSGIMLALPWMGFFSGITIFFAFVPLLFLVNEYCQSCGTYSSVKLFQNVFLGFLIWNTLATGWIIHATISGAIVIILTNTLVYALVFTVFGITFRRLGRSWGFIAFVCFWTCFEGFYTNAEISWPILNLGSSLISITPCIQWYEYTGSLGGSIWILTINYFIFMILQHSDPKVKIMHYVSLGALVVIPLVTSIQLYVTYAEKSAPVIVSVLQPNINPHTEKFSQLSQQQQLAILLDLGRQASNTIPDYFLAPETALDNHLWENALDTTSTIKTIRQFLTDFPNATFITGAMTYYRYQPKETPSATARRDAFNHYYECYNTALWISKSSPFQRYHKSKLVIGVEKTPYPTITHWLGNTFVSLGGISGSLGTQPVRTVFTDTLKKVKIAPVICCESDYGEFVTAYIQQGANIIFELTNDGWFGNSQAPVMHLGNARLRAIETRRSIARSANTGISASINQRGDIVRNLPWWKRGSFQTTLNTNETLTFYVKHGDYLYAISGIMTVFIVFLLIAQFFRTILKY